MIFTISLKERSANRENETENVPVELIIYLILLLLVLISLLHEFHHLHIGEWHEVLRLNVRNWVYHDFLLPKRGDFNRWKIVDKPFVYPGMNLDHERWFYILFQLRIVSLIILVVQEFARRNYTKKSKSLPHSFILHRIIRNKFNRFSSSVYQANKEGECHGELPVYVYQGDFDKFEDWKEDCHAYLRNPWKPFLVFFMFWKTNLPRDILWRVCRLFLERFSFHQSDEEDRVLDEWLNWKDSHEDCWFLDRVIVQHGRTYSVQPPIVFDLSITVLNIPEYSNQLVSKF